MHRNTKELNVQQIIQIWNIYIFHISIFHNFPLILFQFVKNILEIEILLHYYCTETHTCCVYSKYSKYRRILHTHNLSAALIQSNVSVGSCHLSSFLHLESVQPASCPVQPCVFCGPALSTCLTSPQYAAGPGCKISLCLIYSHNCQAILPGHNNF